MTHIPVLLAESVKHLRVSPGAWYVDATFGTGGHTAAILEHGGRVLALDQDPMAEQHAEAFAGDDFHFECRNFRDLAEVLMTTGVTQVRGVLFDLGVSSIQFDCGDRGFSYRNDGPLNMRMDGSRPGAAELVNNATENELAEAIYRFGEDRYSRRIARAIVAVRKSRPIETTQELRAVIERAYPPGRRRSHPARRTFQALRIVVNDELGALQAGLVAAETALVAEGRLVVLSYHSLEDRLVKRFLRGSRRLVALTKHPLTPSPEEEVANPRSRSAKLRAGVKVTA